MHCMEQGVEEGVKDGGKGEKKTGSTGEEKGEKPTTTSIYNTLVQVDLIYSYRSIQRYK